MSKPLTPDDPEYVQLFNTIKNLFELPPNIKRLEVIFTIDEPLAIYCEYYPVSNKNVH